MTSMTSDDFSKENPFTGDPSQYAQWATQICRTANSTTVGKALLSPHYRPTTYTISSQTRLTERQTDFDTFEFTANATIRENGSDSNRYNHVLQKLKDEKDYKAATEAKDNKEREEGAKIMKLLIETTSGTVQTAIKAHDNAIDHPGLIASKAFAETRKTCCPTGTNKLLQQQFDATIVIFMCELVCISNKPNGSRSYG